MKPKAFEITYIRADEPNENYNKTLTPDAFKIFYTPFQTFSMRAKVGDSTTLTLGPEHWSIKAM
jgi:hypothetical protein